MGYRGRVTLLAIAILISAEFNIYDYFHDLPAVKWNVIGGIVISLLCWWLGKKYDRLWFLYQRDDLTNAYKRFYTTKKFPSLAKRADRKQSNVGVFVVDVNNLKTINDSHGHISGDAVIKLVSYTLIGCTRKTDYVTRWGGDEFVIVAPDVDKLDAIHLQERIKDHMISIEVSANQSIQPSVSIGFAIYPMDGQDLEALIHVADVRMYSDKHSNRTLLQGMGPR